MKTLLLALNSQYIHSNLAVWYLKAAAKQDITVVEHNINMPINSVYGHILAQTPDVLGISCYIWNIELVLLLCSDLKKALPGLKIILGGPEATHNPALLQNPDVDYIIKGAGEIAFSQLLQKGGAGDWPRERVIQEQRLQDLDALPSPYTDEYFEACAGKIAYYEAGRGCPFKCAFCLSSLDKCMGGFSLERVKSDLSKICKNRIKIVKFVDRTFNFDKSRAAETLKFIIENTGEACFHFEVAPDLFDDTLLALLAKAPKGKLQIEAGIQTTNPDTCAAINRKTDLAATKNSITKILQSGNVHVHLDLIAGLPFEDLAAFERSFDFVYALRPHCLQVGFLKLLHGTKLREQADELGIVHRDYPPYQVIKTRHMPADELAWLERFEQLFDMLFNSRRFACTLEYLENFHTPFALFSRLARDYNPLEKQSLNSQYQFLLNACAGWADETTLRQCLAIDFFATNTAHKLPDCLQPQDDCKQAGFEFLKNRANVEKYLPNHAGLPPTEIYKRVNFLKQDKAYVFDYSREFAGRYTYYEIDLP